MAKKIEHLTFGVKLKGFIANPVNTFKKVKGKSLNEAFKYYALISLIVSLIVGILSSVVFALLLRYLPEAAELQPFLELRAAIWLLMALMVVMIYATCWVSLLVGGLIIHLGVLIFARPNRGLGETYKALAYSSTPEIFSFIIAIPLLGYVFTFAVGIWSLVLEIIGLKEFHSTTIGRAIAAALVIPIAITIILALITIIIVLLAA